MWQWRRCLRRWLLLLLGCPTRRPRRCSQPPPHPAKSWERQGFGCFLIPSNLLEARTHRLSAAVSMCLGHADGTSELLSRSSLHLLMQTFAAVSTRDIQPPCRIASRQCAHAVGQNATSAHPSVPVMAALPKQARFAWRPRPLPRRLGREPARSTGAGGMVGCPSGAMTAPETSL